MIVSSEKEGEGIRKLAPNPQRRDQGNPINNLPINYDRKIKI